MTIKSLLLAICCCTLVSPAAAKTPVITPADVRACDRVVHGLVGIDDTELRDELTAKACEEAAGCADGCGSYLEAVIAFESSAHEHDMATKDQATCTDQKLMKLLAEAERSGSRDKLLRYARDRFVAFYERVRPHLTEAAREEDDCMMKEMKLRTKKLDHACKPRVVEPAPPDPPDGPEWLKKKPAAPK